MTSEPNQPLVSVLVPLYNHACYIRRCLDSILEDGYPRLEIIIIDDGSRDNSLELVHQWYAECDRTTIEHFELESRPNKGVTRTLNELVAKSHGEYLVTLASDDYLLPGGITARLEYLSEHPLKRAVFGDCIVVDKANCKTHNSGIADLYGGHYAFLTDSSLLPIELIFNWCVPGPGFMAHRSIFDLVGPYDENLKIEDWDMYLRILSRDMLGFIPQAVAAYRYHGENSVVNESMRISQLNSLMQTAWQNHLLFTGIRRFGLLYLYFRHKKEIAEVQGARLSRLIGKIGCKILNGFTAGRYKRLIQQTENHAGTIGKA